MPELVVPSNSVPVPFFVMPPPVRICELIVTWPAPSKVMLLNAERMPPVNFRMPPSELAVTMRSLLRWMPAVMSSD